MSDVFGESIAFEEDDTFTHGNGIGKPLGILNAPALVTVSRTSATDVKIADLVGMVARFRGNVGRAKFMVNQSRCRNCISWQMRQGVMYGFRMRGSLLPVRYMGFLTRLLKSVRLLAQRGMLSLLIGDFT